MARMIVGLTIPAVLWFTAACTDRGPAAWGNANSVIVLAADTLWAAVEDTARAVLEPPIFTVRDERTFELTQVAPGAPAWEDLRLFKQVLLIGEAGDPWIAEVIEDMDSIPASRPAVVEREDVWARGQRVTVLLLPEEGAHEAAVAVLPELHELLTRRFREYAQRRMFTSGPAEALRDTLQATAGFGLLVPQVYRHTVQDSIHVFRNDQALGEPLDRTVVVTWRSGVPDTLTPEAMLAWRESLPRPDDAPQVTQREPIEARPIEVAGARGLEVRGVWSSPPGEWPAAGPFIDRLIVCPEQDRTYLLDAWLFVPGKGKYEYIIQLETILNSFECGRPTA